MLHGGMVEAKAVLGRGPEGVRLGRHEVVIAHGAVEGLVWRGDGRATLGPPPNRTVRNDVVDRDVAVAQGAIQRVGDGAGEETPMNSSEVGVVLEVR